MACKNLGKVIMKRKIYDKLLQWKNEKDGTTALMIEGARRIEKSYIAERFAEKEYESYILIDFSKAPFCREENFLKNILAF